MFARFQGLVEHQKAVGHDVESPSPHGFLCWRKGCNQYFRTKATRAEHFRCVLPLSFSRVSVNSTNFRFVLRREIHSRIYEEEQSRFKHRCASCGLLFHNAAVLQRHSRLHQRLEELTNCSYVCTCCHMQFSSVANLSQHLRECHTICPEPPAPEPTAPEPPVPEEAPAAPEPVLCRFCQISFPSADKFREHEK